MGFVFWRITAHYQREMDRALLSLGLTNLQFVTLALATWFSRSGEPVNQVQLARFGGIHPMQLSHMLKTLESKGFVSRQRSTSDTRAKEVAVTRSGLKLLREAFPLAIKVQAELFGKEGGPGGALHQHLLTLDQRLRLREEP